jgi:transaldolase
MTDPLARLAARGVSIWLDDLGRDDLRDGTIERLVRDYHVTGLTSNPTIFARSITSSAAYDDQLAELTWREASVDEARRALTAYDVRQACDLLRPVFDATEGRDGLVSIEVNPRFAYDAAATVADARALWWQVDRPNVMIKIPATAEGLPAITTCLADGINVNVTLIFSADRYGQVFDAFVAGLKRALQAGRRVESIASVASLFVSRVDTAVDRLLSIMDDPAAAELRGRAALANARLAQKLLVQRTSQPRWQALARAGARSQRLLWASTGTKDPAYDDTRYVTGLVVPGSINTMPRATLIAVADHGVLPATDPEDDADAVMRALAGLGIDLCKVMSQLEDEGVAAFADSWSRLGEAIARRMTDEAVNPPGKRV